MVDEKNTAIITYIDDNFSENLEYDFLETLFQRAHYQGKLIVIDYGVNDLAKERMRGRFPVEFYKSNKIMPVFSNRYKEIPHIIDQLDQNITHVMTIDGGDVWFQTSIHKIYEICEKRIGLVKETTVIGEDDFTNRCIEMMKPEYQKELLSVIGGKVLRNSGVICGPREQMKQYINRIFKDMQRCHTEFFGIDQLYANYEYYQLPEEMRVDISNLYNYVLKLYEYHVVDNLFYNINDELVSVVHNAGGNWRAIERPFKNKNSDYNQYFYFEVRDI